MIIGVPKEIKIAENRIALVPAGAEALVAQGHTVLIEGGAGLGVGSQTTSTSRSEGPSFPTSTTCGPRRT